jgi:DinB superfamily
MNGVKAIQSALEGTRFVLNWYVSDFSDADLLIRPVPEANHAAWQIGHLISAEGHLVSPQLPDTAYPELPAGFRDNHGSEGAKKSSTEGCLTKAEYLSLFDAARSATIAAVGKLSDDDLDRPTTGNMAQFAPTLGQLLILTSNHTLMHAGQLTVIRRALGNPVLF